MYTILTDDDLGYLFDSDAPVRAIEEALRAHAAGELIAPPRFQVTAGTGALVFTAGAETGNHRAIGFRVYDTFPGRAPGRTQLTAVFDSETGALRGLVIGQLLGAIRTAAINAAAIKLLARPDAVRLGVLGCGFQARAHARLAARVRPFGAVDVYSRDSSRRAAFADELAAALGVPVTAHDTPEDVVRAADVLLCATSSRLPVLEATWVRPGTHICSIGPKLTTGSELPADLAPACDLIVTDSLAQVDAYDPPFFLLPTPERARMVELSTISAGGHPGRERPETVTLFCSVGLAGTEVVIADLALTERRARP